MAYWHSLTVISLVYHSFVDFHRFFHHRMASLYFRYRLSYSKECLITRSQRTRMQFLYIFSSHFPGEIEPSSYELWRNAPCRRVYLWPWEMNGRVQCRFDWQLLPTQACLTPATALHYPGLAVSYLQSSLACNESLAMHYSWSTLKDPLLHSERPRERERGRSAHHQGMIPFGLGYQIGHHARVRARPWIYGWALLI